MHLDTSSPGRALAAVAAVFAFSAPAAAQAFDLTDTQGRHHRLADYKGRWVVMNFWATWCVPCIQEIPEIAAFGRGHAEVAVIGVAIDAEDVEKTKRFATQVGHEYPLVLSDDRVVGSARTAPSWPSTRIYDPAAKLRYDK